MNLKWVDIYIREKVSEKKKSLYFINLSFKFERLPLYLIGLVIKIIIWIFAFLLFQNGFCRIFIWFIIYGNNATVIRSLWFLGCIFSIFFLVTTIISTNTISLFFILICIGYVLLLLLKHLVRVKFVPSKYTLYWISSKHLLIVLIIRASIFGL